MTDVLSMCFDCDESVDVDFPVICVMRHRNDGEKEIINTCTGDEAKYIYNVVIGKEKPKTPNEITEKECKSVDDYVKSISHKVDLNYEEFVMFLKAIMTDYDFENFVTLYQDFKENGGELNGWFFEKEE